MIEISLFVILFIMGIYFGSFFTLATYRLPKKENITHKHSYCPNCNHKLGIFDLVPVISYIVLGGKCRYCKQPIGCRYFLFEILTGIVFVLFVLSLNINVYAISTQHILYIAIGILYLASLFMLAGINKEKGTIQKSVLYYGVFVSCIYIVYLCAFYSESVYQYGIYLCIMLLFSLIEILLFKKNLQQNEMILTLIFLLNILIFNGMTVTIFTLFLTIFMIGFENILFYIKYRKTQKVITSHSKKPFLFYISIANIIMLIGSKFLINYMIK